MARIRDRIIDALEGRIPPEELGPHWRHDLAMPIYHAACKLLACDREYERKLITAQIPPRILELCREEGKRLLAYRRQLKNTIRTTARRMK